MIIQDVVVTTATGNSYVFNGVAKKEVKVLAPGMPLLMEFESALGMSLGLIVVQPGMIFKYGDGVMTTSQIDDETGLVKKTDPADDSAKLDE